MSPTIREGEKITVEPVASPATVKVGDIVLYRNCSRVIAHRVVGIETGGDRSRVFILRGDAAGSCDAPIQPEQILGKVVSIERAGRRVGPSSRKAKLAYAIRFWVRRLKACVRRAASSRIFGAQGFGSR